MVGGQTALSGLRIMLIRGITKCIIDIYKRRCPSVSELLAPSRVSGKGEKEKLSSEKLKFIKDLYLRFLQVPYLE